MAYKAYIYNNFSGGQAVDKKVGVRNSFADSQCIDFRKSPSQYSVLPGTTRADSNTVTDLVQNEVMTQSGRTYSIGSNGNVYTCTPNGVWSLFGNIGSVGTFGLNYRQDQDAIYIPGTTSVSSITSVSTNPTLNPGYYGESQSTYDNTSQAGFNVNSNQSGGGKTTAIATVYDDNTQPQQRFWQTDINPVSKIGVNIVAKGTGDWTLVVHDGLNNQLGMVTVTNANLTSNAINYFTFATPIPVNVGPNNAQTYHFHLTSTVADGTVASTAINDLSTCDMQLWANRLTTTTNGIHPQVTFQQFECIGNGRYLSVWENLGEAAPSNSSWQRQKLVFPPGYEVCGLTVFNEYLVIATEFVTTANVAQQGIIFYWDGLSDTYNYFTRIPEGSPESIHEFENAVYYVAGGKWYIISSVAATPQPIRNLPGAENVYINSDVRTRVYPNMGTVRYGIHLLGWPSTTANTGIPYAVYSWGRVDFSQPNSFGRSYVLSTGSSAVTGSNNLTIGMVRNFGNVLHISWRDDSSGTPTYGVDVVNASSAPAPFSKWESLIYDDGMVTRDKQVSYLEANWLDIQNGVSIVLKYSINRGPWVYSDRFSNANLWSPDGHTNYGRLDVGTQDASSEERFNELQVGIDVYCDSTVTQPPVITGVSAIFDSLDNEQLQ
ncbi:hypothetical protein UFOVP253_39 [uncultured Caudovirales phage]|uniref:Uncharacterized protein n=1 Tax=uncultured Caudovirales phage TaxID=2100421 RepID=A0A6J5LDI4_9CAUD|nr:hypothetical protein UFOVP253_39 [uncultured Caudovirales phage]